MRKIYFAVLILAINFLAAFLIWPADSFAKTDLSISETDLTFSKDEPFDGDVIRIYARVFNVGDKDVRGYVIFSINGKETDEPQPISVKANTYDDVFTDWKAKAGAYNIEAKITGASPSDEILENNKTIKKDFFVDLDTDSDGVGDKKDADADNDGLTNDDENKSGTNPLKADTDDDGVNDRVDAFPKDKTEFRDTDNDGLGDNKDLDDDGDGIFDEEEVFKYGTNPLNADTDSDALPDKQEIETGTSPVKPDTDSDGVKDPEDKFPLDPSKWQAGFMNSIISFFKGREYLYFVLGGLTLLILYFLFRRKGRKKK